MDFNALIGAVQLAIAAFQLKLDHFTTPSHTKDSEDLDKFYDLGEAIRILEFALSETVAFVGQTNSRRPNPRLASLWSDASDAIRKIQDNAELADLTFEKNLYWRNPDFYRKQGSNKLYRISLENVLIQLRNLRSGYDKLHKKISD